MIGFLSAALWWLGLIWTVGLLAGGTMIGCYLLADWRQKRRALRKLRVIAGWESRRDELERVYRLPSRSA